MSTEIAVAEQKFFNRIDHPAIVTLGSTALFRKYCTFDQKRISAHPYPKAQ